MAAIRKREGACAALLKPVGGNPLEALALALEDPPYATQTESVKVASCEVVCRVLLMIKEADIEKAVNSLSLDACDVLMKCASKTHRLLMSGQLMTSPEILCLADTSTVRLDCLGRSNRTIQ